MAISGPHVAARPNSLLIKSRLNRYQTKHILILLDMEFYLALHAIILLDTNHLNTKGLVSSRSIALLPEK